MCYDIIHSGLPAPVTDMRPLAADIMTQNRICGLGRGTHKQRCITGHYAFRWRLGVYRSARPAGSRASGGFSGASARSGSWRSATAWRTCCWVGAVFIRLERGRKSNTSLGSDLRRLCQRAELSQRVPLVVILRMTLGAKMAGQRGQSCNLHLEPFSYPS